MFSILEFQVYRFQFPDSAVDYRWSMVSARFNTIRTIVAWGDMRRIDVAADDQPGVMAGLAADVSSSPEKQPSTSFVFPDAIEFLAGRDSSDAGNGPSRGIAQPEWLASVRRDIGSVERNRARCRLPMRRDVDLVNPCQQRRD